jgi:hypothetical protein
VTAKVLMKKLLMARVSMTKVPMTKVPMTKVPMTTPTKAQRWPGHPALLLLERARGLLTEAASAASADERFRLAHLSALRTGAAVLADRGRPASARRRLMSVWVLIDAVAPELRDWALLFASGAPARAAIEAGAVGVVGARAADDQWRAAEQFLTLVESEAGLLAAPLAS